MVPIEFHLAAQRLLMPVNAKAENIIVPMDSPLPGQDGTTVKQKEIAEARNIIVQRALSRPLPAEYIFFIGDDMIPHWDALVLLYEEAVRGDWDILGALYYMKQDGIIPMPILWRDDVVGYLKEGIHYQLGEVAISDVIGMDFTLIKTELFKKLPYPWFKTGPIQNTDIGSVWYFTEDSFFCRCAKYELNAKMGVYTKVRISHLDIVTGEVY